MNKYWFDYYITFLVISLHCKNSDIYSKDRQLWLPELYRKKYFRFYSLNIIHSKKEYIFLMKY